MLISTKGRYALRVMIDFARHSGEKVIPLKDVAERQGISEKYLEAIVKLLVQGGLLGGSRGKNGGYRLLKDPSEITAWDVISCAENSFYAVECLSPDAPKCERAEECATLPLWKDFNDTVRDFFQNYTIEELARKG